MWLQERSGQNSARVRVKILPEFFQDKGTADWTIFFKTKTQYEFDELGKTFIQQGDHS